VRSGGAAVATNDRNPVREEAILGSGRGEEPELISDRCRAGNILGFSIETSFGCGGKMTASTE
jgi:hypothetical protein